MNDSSDLVSGQFTDTSAFDLELAKQESIQWIESVLQEKFATNEDFHSGLKDGQRLCRFINCIKPNSVRRINKSHAPFPSMENLQSFLDACRAIGLKDTTLFSANSFYEGVDAETGGQKVLDAERRQKIWDKILRDVCINIYWLGIAVRAMPGYKGPQLNLAAFEKLCCLRCKKGISDDKYVNAQGKPFHNECFFCDTCSKNPCDPNENFKWDSSDSHFSCAKCRCKKCKECVKPGKYRALDDGPVSACDKICPSCDKENQCSGQSCKNIIDPKNHFVFNSKKYCPNCVCSDENCRKPLYNKTYGVVDGKKYCPDCLCSNCRSLTGTDFLEKGGKKYCRNCYCADEECRKPFVDNMFKECDGKRYCPNCLCATCNSPAGPESVTINGKKYCPNCVCADKNCKRPLDIPNDLYKVVDGSKYCLDCMCHREGCEKYAGEDPAIYDGKKYCKDCLCADSECRKPLVSGEYTLAPKTGEFGDNDKVCKDCLCALCRQYVGKHAAFRKRGEKFCSNCICCSCKVPLREQMQPCKPCKNNPQNKTYCKNCICAKCDAALSRKDKRSLFGGSQYCRQCICSLCDKPLIGKRAEASVPYKNGTACVECQCNSCYAPNKSENLKKYGPGKYCKNCVCSECGKPSTFKRSINSIDGRLLCDDCLCYACKSPLENGVKFGDYSYCKKCVCGKCHSPLDEDTKVVKGPRAFCPRCVCCQCSTVLDGGKYAVFGDNVTCLLCSCARCGRPKKSSIGTTEIKFVKFDGKSYCERCLCDSCEKPLTTDEVVYCSACTCDSCGCLLDDDEEKYCENCGSDKPGFKTKAQNRADRKARNKPLADQKSGAHNVMAPHPKSKPSSNQPNRKAPLSNPVQPSEGEGICYTCGEELTGAVVKALDRSFHKQCLVCFGCRTPFSGGFTVHDGKPYCEVCAGKAAGLPECLECGKYVSGAYLSLNENLNWHQKCFKCVNCLKQLSSGGFTLNQDRKPICKDCCN